ncbi:ParB/RepB/Spo0J family partition protein [Pseudooceanicola sp.]|uniref:ParB/RepB/Spo0J family partition protein n=1 Tax=Pseudooceanicola sp. TaxID=1914328 RepID=UPI004059386E
MQAQAWALAENVTRSDLHPADEVRAYRAMADKGSSAEMIARAFAKSVPHVFRRLALAALEVEVLDALKANRISIDVARALTLAQDRARQIDVMDAAVARNLTAAQVRHELTEAMIRSTDRRVRFVGVEAYIQAGGSITRDLFDGHEFLHDEALIERLFTEKLAAEAKRVASDEGWKWAELVKDPWLSYNRTEFCERLHPEAVELPAGDEEELEQLEDRDLRGHPMTDEEHTRLEQLRARAAGDFDDEVRGTAGVFVLVNQQGRLEVARAYRRDTDVPAGDGEVASGGADDRVEKTGGGEKPLIPQNCLDDLRRIRQLAHQTAMLTQHELLLDLLAYQLETDAPQFLGALGVTVDRPHVTPENDSGLHVDKRLPNDPPSHRGSLDGEGFIAFCAKGKKHRDEVLTRHLARSVRGSNTSGFLDELFAQAGGAALIRKIWSPDAANFFGRVRADYLERIWADLLDLESEDDRRAEFGKLNRKDKAKKLEELFTDASVQEAHGLSRDQVKRIDAWVPAEMWKGAA